jgi:hypothetical protein
MWLIKAAGPDLFCNVTKVDIAMKDRRNGLRAVGLLPRVECIGFVREQTAPTPAAPRRRAPTPEPLTDADVLPLRNLTHLKVLDILSSSQISGVGLTYLKDLTQLQLLGFESDRIADDDLVVLEGLKNLRGLVIAGPRYAPGTRPRTPAKVTDRGLVHLEGLTNLRALYLAYLPITSRGLDHLRPLNRLQALTLSVTDVHDLAPIGGLTQLTSLSVTGPSLDNDGLAEVARLSNLTYLSLGNANVSDPGLKHLSSLSKLVSVDLRATRVTDAGLAELAALPALQSLRLGNTAISDEGLRTLATFPKLRTVGLGQTRVTHAGVAELRKVNPRLTVRR